MLSQVITYIKTDIENNGKDLKFEVGDHVKTSKYRSIFSKVYTPNQPKEVFVIKKIKIFCRGYM